MSARLDSLIARNLSGSAALQARTPSLFEPASQAQGFLQRGPVASAEADWTSAPAEILPGESHDSRTHPPGRPERPMNPVRSPEAPLSEHPDLPPQHADQPSLMDRPAPGPLPARPSQAITPMLAQTSLLAPVHRTIDKHAVPAVITTREMSIPTPPQKPALLTIREEHNSDRPPLVGKVTPAAGKSEHERENSLLPPMRAPVRKALQPARMMNTVGSPANPEPSIQVTIGRIEIRAEREPSVRRKPEPTSPVMGLDDYLRQKNTRVRQ